MSYEIITMPSFRAVGLKWQGTFSEIKPHLKDVINKMEERANELTFKLNPTEQLGLSYHIVENGFVHYAVYKVSEEQQLPDGMLEIKIPQWTYVKTTHHKGQDIDKTYRDLQQWIHTNGYKVFREAGVKYYDPELPIKHEYYPADLDRNDPHFDIYIPIIQNA